MFVLAALKWIDLPRAVAIVATCLAVAFSLDDSVRVIGRTIRYTHGLRTRVAAPESLQVGRYGDNEWIVEVRGAAKHHAMIATAQPTQAEAEALRECIVDAASGRATSSTRQLAGPPRVPDPDGLLLAATMYLNIGIDVMPAAIALISGGVALAAAVHYKLQCDHRDSRLATDRRVPSC